MDNKIQVLEALRRVDKSKNNEGNIDPDDLSKALDIWAYCGEYNDFYNRFKAYYVVKWYCTDSWVGLQAIYFDGELVAASYQDGRKSGTEIDFVTTEAAKKVYDYLLPKFENVKPQYLSSAEAIDDTYTVDYGTQLLVDEGFYQDKKVKVIKKFGLRYERDENWRTVMIEHEDGKQEVIQLADFKIPLHITTP